MSVIVQWEDSSGNLYEAAVYGSAHSPSARIKRWNRRGRSSAEPGAHEVLWQVVSSPAKLWRVRETTRDMAERFGCPPEKAAQIERSPWD